jgi:glycosyltransferase involved in cell wall biosynthesis
MFRATVDAAALIYSGLAPNRTSLVEAGWRRRLVILGLAVILPLALLYYWIGLGVDEIVFRGYRRVAVRRPVFILGVPRSGTTALHEALAQDGQFTTQRTWECLLAPAISHRYLWRGLARLDRLAGNPLRRTAGWFNRRWLAGLTQAHPLALSAPEEDYLSLLPQLSAFILVVAFPDSARLWRLGRGDGALTEVEKARLMRAYHRSIQRHLYFHGSQRIYLAKNASHAVLAASLCQTFPDARFIACLRDPQQVVSSQLASLVPAMEALHGRIRRPALTRRMTRQLRFAYTHLLAVLPQKAPQRSVFVPLGAQRHGLQATLTAIYPTLGLTLSPAFARTLAGLDEKARHWQSGHRHQAADFGLTGADIEQAFGFLRAGFDFAARRPIPATEVERPSPPLNVVVVSDAIPQRNGVGTYYHDLLAHLADQVGQIGLITPATPGIPHWWEGPMPGDATQSIALPSPAALQTAITDQTPDVIVAATPGPYGVIATHIARRLGMPLIAGLHTDFESIAGLYFGPVRGRLNRLLMRWVNRYMFSRAAAVVGNATAMQRLARARGARRAVPVTTPVPRDFIDTPPARLNTPPQRLLFVGRLAEEKRVETLIDTADAHPDLQIRIAGDGPLRSMVEAAAQRLENLEYLGWMTRPSLREALDAVDMLVLPSRIEAFGTVALEAMARGRITLVTRGCGITDWPDLAAGLHIAEVDEPIPEAVARVRALPADALTRRAQTGRDAACAMAHRCTREWLELLHAPESAR